MRLNTSFQKMSSNKDIEKIYPLYNANEFNRLEIQNSYPQYDINTELDDSEVLFPSGSQIIDAGCGSGTVLRKLLKVNKASDIEIMAIDINPYILESARASLSDEEKLKVKFLDDDVRFLRSIEDESMDAYISRFVFEYHPLSGQDIANNAFRILKKGGKIIIIDADNVMLGLKTNNQKLRDELADFRKKITSYTDEICAHIPRFLINAGFKLSQPKAIPVVFFSQNEKEFERDMYKQRFMQMRPTMLSFWPEQRIQRFTEIFLNEIVKPETLIRYEKFVFYATKA